MGVACTRDHGVALRQVPLLVADGEAAGAPKDVIDLVRDLEGVDFLGLARQ